VRRTEERRSARRYELHLPLHYRVSQRGYLALSGTGVTRELSSAGLSFRSRRPLPVGGHVELAMEWPAKHGDAPLEFIVTGIIIRSDGGRTAVRLTSKRFRAGDVRSEPFQATA
jgi:hypothetical protein